jgi:hypothetical protein
MIEMTGGELLALPVRLHGIQVGRPVDLLLDRDVERAVGLDVLCGDDVHRFLPLPTAAVCSDEIRILSRFVLLEQRELDFYRSRTLPLSRLRGGPVEEQNGRRVGPLRDVVVARDGRVIAAIVDEKRIPFEAGLRFAPKRRSAA